MIQIKIDKEVGDEKEEEIISPYCILNETGCPIQVQYQITENLSQKINNLDQKSSLNPVIIQPCQRINFQTLSDISTIFSTNSELSHQNRVSVKLISKMKFEEVKRIDLDKVTTNFYTLNSGITNKRFMLSS